MKLKKLLKNIDSYQIRGTQDVEILGLSNNSKLVAPGHLFIAKKGHADDGTKYIPEAVASGAAAIVSDIFEPRAVHIPQIIHPSPSSIEASLAAAFYGNPSKELLLVGITGTNGKTTSAYLIRHLLEKLKTPSGLIGTIEYIVGKTTHNATRTTPDVIGNQRMLREMVDSSEKACVMEVSSHALMQNRVKGLYFDADLFTNLTSEHLDYHVTMENYAAAKSHLFEMLDSTVKKNATAIVNIDSPWHEAVTKKAKGKKLTFSTVAKSDFTADEIELATTGTHFTLLHEGLKYRTFVPLVGRYNLYNALGAIATVFSLGFPLEKILEALSSFSTVRGRLEPVPNPFGLFIFVDYAHKPDALENVLETLSEFKTGKIITLFGAGGDRDRIKRPKMAEASERLSDFTIITNDNPRSEDPKTIADEIICGFRSKESFLVELDREKAIEKAIKMATPGDIVLIAGKGHETYQIFQHKTIEFDDRKVAAQVLGKLCGALCT